MRLGKWIAIIFLLSIFAFLVPAITKYFCVFGSGHGHRS